MSVACLRRYTVVLPVLLFLVPSCSEAWNQDYYTAAVYEHNRQGDDYKYNAESVIKANLGYYRRAAKLASKQGADLILFPEYGLFSPLHNRTEQKKYMEFVPDPAAMGGGLTPCDKKGLFSDSPIMYTLSCMAKENRIVVVANMGSIEKCTEKTCCPDDGELLLNANVVFDKNGTLIARYYKERLFFEEGMDLPRKPQNPVFQTEFGKFATFICFDIVFEKMARTSRMEDLEAVLFSTMWMNSSPFYQATQLFQAWAVGNNATLLASNIQIPGWMATGSGIFTGRSPSVAYTLNPDGMSKLIVAEVPRKRKGGGIPSAAITGVLKNGTVPDWKDGGQDVPEVCSYYILGPAKDPQKDYRCINDDVRNYTLAKLIRAKDRLEVCNGGMCCQLDYATNGMNESYYLGVFNGTHNALDRYFWWVENCFLARCDDINGTACSTFPTMSHGTLFHRVSLKANFTTDYVYPSFVSDRVRLVPLEDWTFHKSKASSSIEMYSVQGIPLIAATIKGRVYEKDPPYIR